MVGKLVFVCKLLMIWKYIYSIIDWINYYRNDMIIYKIILVIVINLNFFYVLFCKNLINIFYFILYY